MRKITLQFYFQVVTTLYPRALLVGKGETVSPPFL